MGETERQQLPLKTEVMSLVAFPGNEDVGEFLASSKNVGLSFYLTHFSQLFKVFGGVEGEKEQRFRLGFKPATDAMMPKLFY